MAITDDGRGARHKCTFSRIASLTKLVTIILSAAGDVSGSKCDQQSACRCTYRGGQGVYDLNGVGNIQITQGSDVFFYNPCSNVEVGSPTPSSYLTSNCYKHKPTAVCQLHENIYYNLGKLASSEFQGDPSVKNGLSVYYEDTTTTESFTVRLVCEDESKVSRLANIKQNPTGHFSAELRSPHSCPTYTLSTGSILCIILLLLLVVYLFGGFLYLKFVRGASGEELIPNAAFWKELPFYIRDGVFFTKNGCRVDQTYQSI